MKSNDEMYAGRKIVRFKTGVLKCLLIFVLFLLFCPGLFYISSFQFSVCNAGEISAHELNFIDAELRDIIYSFAAANELEIFVFEDVRGRASIKLDGSDGRKVLKKLVQTSGYSWREIDGVIFVGGGNESFTHMKQKKTAEGLAIEDWKVVSLKNIYDWQEEWCDLLDKFYPEILRLYKENQNRMILAGHEDSVVSKKKLLRALFPGDDERMPEKKSVKIISVPAGEELEYDFLMDIPELELGEFSRAGFLHLKGPETLLSEIKKIVESYVSQSRRKKININLNYTCALSITESLSEIYDDEKANINPLNSSTILLEGMSSSVERMEDFIRDIDRPEKQVLVEFELMEISSFDSEGETSLRPPELSLKMEAPYNLKYKLKWEEFLRAAREKGELETVAASRVSTLSGEKANLHIGEQLPITREVDGDKKVDYMDTGIILKVLPEVNEKNEIKIELEPTISSAEREFSGYPVINRRSLTSSVRLQEGETHYLGGISRERFQSTVKSSPPLSHLPLLGRLFKEELKQDENRELIISITPYLYESRPAELQEITGEKRIE